MKHQVSTLCIETMYYLVNDEGRINGYENQQEPIPQIGALYALWNDNVVVYVGITNDLRRRIFEHAKEKAFSHFSFYPCDDLRGREELEIVFYEVLNPILNKEHPADSHRRTNPTQPIYDDDEIEDDSADDYWFIN